MRVNLLFGFLGSGKTTLVRRMLEERAHGRRMAVIVNEFGEVGVDGEIISGKNVDLVELTSGCLCCTLRGSLMSAVEELRERGGVEQIIVEATGVASPGDMLEDLCDSKVSAEIDVGPVVTVVDAPKFIRLREMLGPFYDEQVENADVILLNKVDLARADELEAAGRAVRELNPDAVLLFAERGDTDLALLLDGPKSALLEELESERGSGRVAGVNGGEPPPVPTGGDGNHVESHHHHHGAGDDPQGHHHEHAPAESFVVDVEEDLPRGALEAMFAALPAGIWRVKGFLVVDGRPSLLQYTVGQLEITDAEPRPRGYLVVIGCGLDRVGFESALAAARGGSGA